MFHRITLTYDDFLLQEPAKYQFEYQVSDPESGNEFGHKEERDGDLTNGEYNVLLPDGKKQIVTYTADTDGYHPVVTYEGKDSYMLSNVI